MSTDMFGVRVRDVDPDRREVRFQVLVVYYDVEARAYLLPPEQDPGFFLSLIWESGRWEHLIGETVSVDRILDPKWLAQHARWFVKHVERTGVENDPPASWAKLKDFYYERDGGWVDEDLLVQAEFLVRVTDPAWIEHLEPGDAWGRPCTRCTPTARARRTCRTCRTCTTRR
ncbi:hypothetical protein [Saccharopolyspora shandongensis]|uniref:hypothetical protein n=1 Tax=Saccharopolyspora shandongensis TaxID=418495 RepID=UPI0034020BB9